MKKVFLLITATLSATLLFSQNPLMLKDVYPGATGSGIGEIVKTANYVFFTAEDEDADKNRGLYRTDGTPAGTTKLNLTYPTYISTKAEKLTALGDKVVFAGDNLNFYGEVWVSDGTQAGTIALERFQPTITSNNSNRRIVMDMARLNSDVLYGVKANDNHLQLKKTNGTPGALSVIKDFGIFGSVNAQLALFKELNGILYFILYDGVSTDQLWRSDGTTAGTYLVNDFTASRYVASNLMPAGNQLYIMLVEPGVGDVLWKSDGTTAGTVPVKTINPIASSSNNYPAFAANGNTLYFSGYDAAFGKELWSTNGTAAGTNRLTDLYPGTIGSNPHSLTIFNNTLFFAAESAANGRELFQYTTQASVVRDISPGTANSWVGNLIVSNNTLLFTADNGLAGNELWITNGTGAGTKQVADINPGSGSANLLLLTASGNNIYFAADNGLNGQEIFTYNNSGGVTTGFTYQTIYVNDNSTAGDIYTSAVGNDDNPGTPEAPVATITKAVAMAQAGYTVLVDAGKYTEQVTLDKGLVLKGAGSTLTTVELPSSLLVAAPGFGEYGVIQTAPHIDDVTIQGFTIDGKNIYASGPVWGVMSQTGGLIFQCEIKNMANNGVFVRYTGATPRSVNVSNNYIHHFNYIGIDIQGTALSTFSNNNKIDGAGGFYVMSYFLGGEFGPLSSSLIFNNDISNYNGWGIKINSNSALVVQNSLTGPGTAIQNEGPTLNGTCNWFGTTDKTIIASKISGAVNYTPWLIDGTDASPGLVGFQLSAGACLGNGNEYYVNDNSQTGDRFTTAVGNDANPGTKASPFATIAQAYAVAPAGSRIYVDAGNFDLGGVFYTFNKAMTFVGPNFDKSPNNSSDKRQYNNDRNGEANLSNFQALISSSYLVFEGFTFDAGNVTAFRLFNSSGTNNDFGKVQFRKNVFKINGTGTPIHLTGKFVSTPALPTTSGFTIDDNRIEKSGSGVSTSFIFEYVKDVTVNNNAFVVTGSTFRTQLAMNFGSNIGIVDGVTVTNNLIDQASTAINGPRLSTAIIAGNTIDNSNSVLNVASSIAEGTNITFSNNSMTNNTGGTPFIGYSRTGTSLAGTSNKLLLENNTVTGILPTGSVGQLAAFLNLTFTNSVLDPSVIIRGNKINYSGDFSQSQSHLNRPITVRGNIKAVTISQNEIVYEGSAMLPYSASSGSPENPAITINTDFTASAWMPDNAIVSITNNSIKGFKQSIVFYDPTNAGKDTYTGYGNIYFGAAVSVNNNSFTNDVISVNNGADGGAAVSANCNWFGTTVASEIAARIQGPVSYTPWLTSGLDASTAVGFQPVAESCNGTPPVITVDSQSNILCKDGNGGEINITVSGGGTPYAYAWTKEADPAFTSTLEDPAALKAGVYHVMVTDAFGSTATTDITLTEPELLTAAPTGTNNTCYGGAVGSATVNVNGGTAPYIYLWSTGTGTATIENLIAGDYTVSVTDANGCAAAASYTVTQPSQLLPIITNTSTACANSASVSVSGGTGIYSYRWSNGSTVSAISGVPAGTYTVIISDANNCTATASVTLVAKEAFNPSVQAVDVSCYGGQNGSLTVTNVNGNAPFQYSLNGMDFQESNVFNGLAAGSYTITVKDATGCTGFITKSISQPPVLTVVQNSVTSTCEGQSNGAITVTASGGSGAYTYAWTGPNGFVSAKQNPTGLAVGTYSLTVTDKNGCNVPLTSTVAAYNAIVVSAVPKNISCKGELDGSISLSVSGGSGADFQYSWSNGATTKDIVNLGVGNYSVTIMDAATGCTLIRSFTITQPTSIVSMTTAKTNATGCSSMGTISATGSGGVSPYQYKLNNGSYAESGSFTGLPSGDYTVWVKDVNGCTTSKLITITDNGGDEYESNNSKNAAKAITIGQGVNARIALSTDIADWFKFTTPAGSGQYIISLTHPSVAYTFTVYPATNNAAALVPVSSSAGSKQFVLNGGTTYYISVTGSLSYACYNLVVIPSFASVTTVNRPGEEQKILQQVPEKLEATVYPNPHQGSFTIQISSPEDGTAHVALFSAGGQKLAEKTIGVKKGTGNQTTFSPIAQGMLFYRISIGGKEVMGKIIGVK